MRKASRNPRRQLQGWLAEQDSAALLLYFLALVIIGVRPLIQEAHSSERNPFVSQLPGLPETGPVPTLWINLAILGLFGLTVALRKQGRLLRPRVTGLGIGFALVAMSACASCLVASNHRLAINVTLDWLTLPLLAIAFAHLLQRAWQMRLALCVIIATGAASAVECFDEVWVGMPDTIKRYELQKDEFWRKQGVPPGSYHIELFERRLYENAANSFFSFSNVAGSYFVLVVAAGLALAVWNRSNPWHAAALCALAGIVLWALWLTRSRGAQAGLLIGAIYSAAATVLQRKMPGRQSRAFITGWAVILVGLTAVGVYGLLKGKLPGGSLTYRWWYLESAAEMTADHPWLGVGSGQFGRYYPRYKGIKSPEEIANPHNFLAQSASEWGLGGLAGMMLMLIGGSRVAAGCLARSGTPGSIQETGSDFSPMAWGVVLLVSVWALKMYIDGLTDPQIIVGRNMLTYTGWACAFTLCAASRGLVGSGTSGHTRITPELVLAAGLLAFLVHNLITFSLFIPGSGTTFFALFAVLAAARNDSISANERPLSGAASTGRELRKQNSGQRGRRGMLLCTPVGVGTLALLLVVYWLVVRPAGDSWKHLQTARHLIAAWTESGVAEAAGAHAEEVNQAYDEAQRADPLDPTPALEHAQYLLASMPPGNPNGPEFTLAVNLLENIVRWTDPESLSARRLLADAYAAAGRHAAQPTAAQGPSSESTAKALLLRAASHIEQILIRYPSSTPDHVRAAEIHAALYEYTAADSARERAIREYQIALELDDQRDPLEVRRFSADQRAQLAGELNQLRHPGGRR